MRIREVEHLAGIGVPPNAPTEAAGSRPERFVLGDPHFIDDLIGRAATAVDAGVRLPNVNDGAGLEKYHD